MLIENTSLENWRNAISLPIIQQVIGRKWKLEHLRSVLRSAIRRSALECLDANKGRICMTLSGGIDSSYCLAVVRESFGSKMPIHTFTVVSDYNHPDAKYSRLVAKKFGTFHHECMPSDKAIAEAELLITEKWSEFRKNGDAGVLILYDFIRKNHCRCVMTHDGADELLGGYWEHRKQENDKLNAQTFDDFWRRLGPEHLKPLEIIAMHNDIGVLFPYLYQPVINYISRIGFKERTSREVSKIPLRLFASTILPKEVVLRKKIGFCDALTNPLALRGDDIM